MRPRLIVLDGPLAGRTIPVSGETVSIGREHDCTIPLNDGGASRHHCEIRLSAGGAGIRDLGSRNGTLVNGSAIESVALRHGDEIRVGSSRFLFENDEEEPETDDVAPRESAVTLVLRQGDSVYTTGAPAVSRRAVRDLKSLLDFARTVPECDTEEEIQDRLISMVFEATVADCVAIVSEADGTLRGFDKRGAGVAPRISQTILERVRAERVSVLSNDIPRDEQLASSESLAVRLVHSVLAVPLEERGSIENVLYLENSNPDARFDKNDLELLTALGNVASLAIRNARRMEALAGENSRLKTEIGVNHGIVGESAPVRDLLRVIARLAPIDSTVLVTGESGTGKELVARAIHAGSSRRQKPFVAINCAAMTETLLESELFGHEKGAFTGAVGQKKGKIEAAEGGVLFLDEVGEMSQALQVKLLRVLQEREFERVGGNKTIKADVRLVAATNRDLREMSRTGEFRPDLYYRLNVVAIKLPPLRERRGDIPLLAQHFIAKYAAQTGRRVLGLSQRAKAALVRHDWPGNIRELQNAIERAVALGSGDLIEPDDLPETVLEGSSDSTAAAGSGLQDQVNEAKRQIIVRTIEEAGNNYTEAAHRLGIHPNHLFRLIKTLKLTPKRHKMNPQGSKTQNRSAGQ